MLNSGDLGLCALRTDTSIASVRASTSARHSSVYTRLLCQLLFAGDTAARDRAGSSSSDGCGGLLDEVDSYSAEKFDYFLEHALKKEDSGRRVSGQSGAGVCPGGSCPWWVSVQLQLRRLLTPVGSDARPGSISLSVDSVVLLKDCLGSQEQQREWLRCGGLSIAIGLTCEQPSSSVLSVVAQLSSIGIPTISGRRVGAVGLSCRGVCAIADATDASTATMDQQVAITLFQSDDSPVTGATKLVLDLRLDDICEALSFANDLVALAHCLLMIGRSNSTWNEIFSLAVVSGSGSGAGGVRERPVEFVLSAFEIDLALGAGMRTGISSAPCCNCFCLALDLQLDEVSPQKFLVIELQNIRGQVCDTAEPIAATEAVMVIDSISCFIGTSIDSVAPMPCAGGAADIDTVLAAWVARTGNLLALQVADLSLTTTVWRRHKQTGNVSSSSVGGLPLPTTAALWSRRMHELSQGASPAVRLALGAVRSPCLSMEVVGTLSGVINRLGAAWISGVPRHEEELRCGGITSISTSCAQNSVGEVELSPFSCVCSSVTVGLVSAQLQMPVCFKRNSAVTPLLNPRITPGLVDTSTVNQDPDQARGPEKTMFYHIELAAGFSLEFCEAGSGLAQRAIIRTGGLPASPPDRVRGSFVVRYAEELKGELGQGLRRSECNLLHVDIPQHTPLYTLVSHVDNFLQSPRGVGVGVGRSYSALALESVDGFIDVKFIEAFSLLCGECARYELPFATKNCRRIVPFLTPVFCASTGCSIFDQPAHVSASVLERTNFRFSFNDGEYVCRLGMEQLQIHSSLFTHFDQRSGPGLLYDTLVQTSGCVSGLMLQDLSSTDAKHVEVVSTVHNAAAVEVMMCEPEPEGDGRVYADASDSSCESDSDDSDSDSDSCDGASIDGNSVNSGEPIDCIDGMKGACGDTRRPNKGSYLEFHLTTPASRRVRGVSLQRDPRGEPVLSPVLEIRVCDMRVLYLQRSLFTLISYFRDHMAADWFEYAEEALDAVSAAAAGFACQSSSSGCVDTGVTVRADAASFLRWSVQLFNSELHLPCSSAGCDALVVMIRRAQILQQVTSDSAGVPLLLLDSLNKFCRGPSAGNHKWLSDLLTMKTLYRDISNAHCRSYCLPDAPSEWNLGSSLQEHGLFVSPRGLGIPVLGACTMVKLSDAALCTWCSSNIIGEKLSLEVKICPGATSVADAARDSGTPKNASAKAPLFNSQVEIDVITTPLRWKLSQGQYQAIVHVIQQNVCELTCIVPDVFAADAKVRYSDECAGSWSSQLPKPGESIIPQSCPIFSYVRLHLPLAELTLVENSPDYYVRYLSMLRLPVWSARIATDNSLEGVGDCDLDSVPIWASHHFYCRKLFSAADRRELEGDFDQSDHDCGLNVEFSSASVAGDEVLAATVLIDELKLDIYQMHGVEGNGIELTARSLLVLSPTTPSDAAASSEDTRYILHSTPVADRLPCTPGDVDSLGMDGSLDLSDGGESASEGGDHAGGVCSSAAFWAGLLSDTVHPREFYDCQVDGAYEYYYYAPQQPPERPVDSAVEQELIGMTPSAAAAGSSTHLAGATLSSSTSREFVDRATEEELVGMIPSLPPDANTKTGLGSGAGGVAEARVMSEYICRLLDETPAERIVLGPSWLPHLSPSLYASWQAAEDGNSNQTHFFSNKSGLRLFHGSTPVSHSLSQPQVHFSLQFNANCYRRAILNLNDTCLSVQLSPLSALVAFFADPVHVSTQRMYEVVKLRSGNWCDYCVQFGLFVNTRNTIISIANSNYDTHKRSEASTNRIKAAGGGLYSGARRVPHVLCIHTNVSYAHSWHGMQFIGPALVECSLSARVHSVYIAALNEVQHGHVASLFANFNPVEDSTDSSGVSVSLALQHSVVPAAASFEQNVGMCAPVIDPALEWLKVPVAESDASDERLTATGSMCVKVAVTPISDTRTEDAEDLVMLCRASLMDMQFIGGAIAAVQASSASLMQRSLLTAPLVDKYRGYDGSYVDCAHLPLLSHWIPRHIRIPTPGENAGNAGKPEESEDEDESRMESEGKGLQPSADNIKLTITAGIFSSDFHILLRNHTYNIDILRLELSKIRFVYSVFDGEILMETSVDASAFVLNDSINKFNTARYIDYCAIASGRGDKASGHWEPVLECVHFEGCATSDGKSSAGEPLRLSVQVESTSLDTTLSYSLLSVLLRKLSLADVVTSISAQLPPYRIINHCGLSVEARLNIGKHNLATETVSAGSFVGIDMQKLSRNGDDGAMNPYLKEIMKSKQSHSLSITLASGANEVHFTCKDSLPVDHECSYERFDMCTLQSLRCAVSASSASISVSEGAKQSLVPSMPPIVFMSMAVDKLHGGREIQLNSMFSVQNNTRRLVLLCIARPGDTDCSESVSVSPGESWQVPAHLCYHDSCLKMKLMGQGASGPASASLENGWCVVAQTLAGFIQAGSWGNPKLLRAAVVSLPDAAGCTLGSTGECVLFVRPQAPKQLHNSGFFSGEAKSACNSPFVPLKLPAHDLIRFGISGDELSPNFLSDAPNKSRSFIGRGGTASNATAADCRPLSLVIQPAVQLCNLVCQPLMYRLTSVSPLLRPSQRGKNSNLRPDPSAAIAEGALVPSEICDIYELASLYRTDIYISVRLLNYGWSNAVLLFAAESTLPAEEERYELVLSSLFLQTSHGDDVLLPSIKITVTTVENLVKFTSAAWITNKTGLPLDICDSSSVSFSKNKPHSTFVPTNYEIASSTRSIESILTAEGASSLFARGAKDLDTAVTCIPGIHAAMNMESRFKIINKTHYGSAAAKAIRFENSDDDDDDDDQAGSASEGGSTVSPPSSDVDKHAGGNTKSSLKDRGSLRIIKLQLHLSANHFESVEVLASADWTVAEAFQQAVWSAAASVSSASGGSFFDADNSHYYSEYNSEVDDETSAAPDGDSSLTRLANNYVVLPVDRDASWQWDRSINTFSGDSDDDQQSVNSGGSDVDSDASDSDEQVSMAAIEAEHRAEEAAEKERIMEALKELDHDGWEGFPTGDPEAEAEEDDNFDSVAGTGAGNDAASIPSDEEDEDTEDALLRAEEEEEKRRIREALERLQEEEEQEISDGEDEGFGEEDVGRVVDEATAAEERLTRFLLAANSRKQREEVEVVAPAAAAAAASPEKVRRKSLLGSIFGASQETVTVGAISDPPDSGTPRRQSFTRRLSTGSLFSGSSDTTPASNGDPITPTDTDTDGSRRPSVTHRMTAGALFGMVDEGPVAENVGGGDGQDGSTETVTRRKSITKRYSFTSTAAVDSMEAVEHKAVGSVAAEQAGHELPSRSSFSRRFSFSSSTTEAVTETVTEDHTVAASGDGSNNKRPSFTKRLSLTASSLFGTIAEESSCKDKEENSGESVRSQRRASAPDNLGVGANVRSSIGVSAGASRRASISLASTSLFKKDGDANKHKRGSRSNQMRRNWEFGFLAGCQLSPISMSALVRDLGDVVSLRLCHVVEFQMFKQVTNFKSDFMVEDNAISRMLNKQHLVYKTAMVTLPCTRDCIPYGPVGVTISAASGKSSGTSSGISVRIGNSFSAWSSSFKPFTFEFGRRLIPEHIQLVLGGLAPANIGGKVSADTLPKVELGVHVSRNENGSRLLRDSVALALVPRFLLVSTLPFAINIRQFLGIKALSDKQAGTKLKLLPGTTEAFNFESYEVNGGSRCLQISRLGAPQLWCGEIAIDTIGISHAKLRNPVCIIKVQVDVVGASFVATFSQQSKSWPPVRIDNRTSFDIQYKQLLPANKSSGVPHDDNGKMLWDPLSCQSSCPYVYDYPTSGSRAVCIGFVPQSRYKTAGNVYHAGMVLTDMVLEKTSQKKGSASASVGGTDKFSSFPAPENTDAEEKFVTLYGKTPRVANPVLTGCFKCDLSPFDAYNDGNDTDTFGTDVSSLLASDVDPVHISPHSAFRTKPPVAAALQALGVSEPDNAQMYHCVLKADVIYIYEHDRKYCSASAEYQRGAPQVLKGIVQLLGSKSNMNMKGKNVVSFPVFTLSKYIHADRPIPPENNEAQKKVSKPRRSSIFESLKARMMNPDEDVAGSRSSPRRGSSRLSFFSDSGDMKEGMNMLPTSMSSLSSSIVALNRTDNLYIRCLLFRVCHALCLFDRVNVHGVRGAHGHVSGKKGFRNMDHYFDHVLSISVSGNDICTALIVLNEATDEIVAGNILQKLLMMGYIVAAPTSFVAPETPVAPPVPPPPPPPPIRSESGSGDPPQLSPPPPPPPLPAAPPPAPGCPPSGGPLIPMLAPPASLSASASTSPRTSVDASLLDRKPHMFDPAPPPIPSAPAPAMLPPSISAAVSRSVSTDTDASAAPPVLMVDPNTQTDLLFEASYFFLPPPLHSGPPPIPVSRKSSSARNRRSTASTAAATSKTSNSTPLSRCPAACESPPALPPCCTTVGEEEDATMDKYFLHISYDGGPVDEASGVGSGWGKDSRRSARRVSATRRGSSSGDGDMGENFEGGQGDGLKFSLQFDSKDHRDNWLYYCNQSVEMTWLKRFLVEHKINTGLSPSSHSTVPFHLDCLKVQIKLRCFSDGPIKILELTEIPLSAVKDEDTGGVGIATAVAEGVVSKRVSSGAHGRVQVAITLRSLTVSIIDDMSSMHQHVRSSTQTVESSPTEELLFLRLDRLGMGILREVQHLSMHVSVQSIQLDNMCMRPDYPVVLHPRYVITQEQSGSMELDQSGVAVAVQVPTEKHVQNEYPTLHVQFVKKFSSRSVWLLGSGGRSQDKPAERTSNQKVNNLSRSPVRVVAVGTPMHTPAPANRSFSEPTAVAPASADKNATTRAVDGTSSEEDKILYFESFSCWLAPMALNLSEELVIRLCRMFNSLTDGGDLAGCVGGTKPTVSGAGTGDAFMQMNTVADLHLGDINALYYQALNSTTIVYSLHNAIAKYSSRHSRSAVTAEQARLLAESERLMKHLMKYSSHDVRATLSSTALTRSNRIVYVGLLRIHPVDVICSFKPTAGFRSTISELKFLYLLDQMGGRAQSRVCLNPFITANSFGSVEVYENVIGRHYKNSLFLQFPKLFANNNDFLQGTGLNLVANLGSGVYDLFYEPLDGLMQEGVGTFVTGLGKGSKSMASKTVAGTSGFTSTIAGTLGTGVSIMTFDTEFQRERASRRLHHLKSSAVSSDNFSSDSAGGGESGGFGRGIAVGASELGSSVVDGLAGIVLAPYAGFMEAGASGFGIGLAKGILGAALKPAVGVLDLASRTAEGIMNSSSGGSATATADMSGDPPLQQSMARYRLPRSFGRMSEFSYYDPFAASAQYIADKLCGFGRHNKCKVVHYYHIPRYSLGGAVPSRVSVSDANANADAKANANADANAAADGVSAKAAGDTSYYVSPSVNNTVHSELPKHNMVEPWASFCPTTSQLLLVTADRILLVSLTATAHRALQTTPRAADSLSFMADTGPGSDMEGISLVWSCPGHCVSEIGADAAGNIVLYLAAPLEWKGTGGLDAAMLMSHTTDTKANSNTSTGNANGDGSDASSLASLAWRSNVNRQAAALWSATEYSPAIADGLFAEHVLFRTLLELTVGVQAAREQLIYPPGLGLISPGIGKKNVGGLRNFLSATTPRLYQLYGNVLYEYSPINPDSDSATAVPSTACARYTRGRYYTNRRVTDKYIRGIFSSTFQLVSLDASSSDAPQTQPLPEDSSESELQRRICAYQESIMSEYYIRRMIPLADIQVSGPTPLGGAGGSNSASGAKQKYSLTLSHKGAKSSGGAMLCLHRKDSSASCKLAPATQDQFSMIFPDKETVSAWLRGFTEAILSSPADVIITDEHAAVLSSAQRAVLEADRDALSVPAPVSVSAPVPAPVALIAMAEEETGEENKSAGRRRSQSKDITSFLAAAESAKAAQQTPKDISSFVAAATASQAAYSAASSAAELMSMDIERFIARNSVLHQLVIPTPKDCRGAECSENVHPTKTMNERTLEQLKLQLTHTILLSRIEIAEAEVQESREAEEI